MFLIIQKLMSKTKKSFVLFSLSFLIFIGSFLLTSCISDNKLLDVVIIEGKLKNTNREKVLLFQIKPDSLNIIDSILIDDEGCFEFEYKPDDTYFYMLKISDDNFITLLLEKGEKALVTGNCLQLANDYKVEGSVGSEKLLQLNKFTRNNYKKTDSLLQVIEANKSSTDFAIIKLKCDSVYNIVFKNQQQFVMQFIKNNSQNLASLIALYQKFGRIKVLNEREHFSYYQFLDSTLHIKYPENIFVSELNERVKKIKEYRNELSVSRKKLDTAMMAPEISLKNLSGQLQPLSSVRGRIVMILFWAASNYSDYDFVNSFKYIQKMYQQKGFMVYAVSLDEHRAEWEKAVKDLNLNWVHVSDLMGWDSPYVMTYGLETIPYAVLIDKDGKIIKSGINKDELIIQLNKIYKN